MKGELWKASFEQCRHATSEEQTAKELLAGELEALKEDKRTFRDMTGQGAPGDDDLLHREAERFDRFSGGVKSERPGQRPRNEDGRDVEIPEDSELEYEPSEEEREGDPFPDQPPRAPDRTTESEPEPVPVQKGWMEVLLLTKRRGGLCKAVRKDEPSTNMWYSLEGDKWTWEPEVWEEISKDLAIRQHNFPRKQLCNPVCTLLKFAEH